ncbi:MAG: cell division protein FtsA [Bdellovibrio sp.]|nr:MAG: cell division protein FtsA [Bdellovibrio sp.]
MSKVPANTRKIIAGLDIGTTKVVFLIGAMTSEELEVIGVGTAPNTGVKQGVVVNIDHAVSAIRKAKEEAELMAGVEAQTVWLGVAGAHIESFDSFGMVAIKNEEVEQGDVDRVIEAAKAVAIPADRQVLHILPSDYKIDGQEGICDPVGMSGVRLEAKVHIVTGNHSAIQNIVKCTEKAGLSIEGLVLQQLASSMAVLSEDEKNLGVAVIDMGGGTSDLVIYHQGSVVYTGVVPVGGNHFTHDVAMGLRTTQQDAEQLKNKYGCALPGVAQEGEVLDVAGVGGRSPRTVERKTLCEILEARAEETLRFLKDKVVSSGYHARLGSGLVLTGGGSQLGGLVEMGEFVFDCPVRRATPQGVGGLVDVVRSPAFASSVGLLKYGQEKSRKQMAVDKGHELRFNDHWNDFVLKIKNFFA